MKREALPFIDLAAQRRRLGAAMDEAILRVVDHGGYIMGPEIADLERALSDFCGARACVTCANGTDALALFLMAKGVRPGDAVIVPSFTFAATAEVVAWLGATCVFADIEPDSYNMAADSLAAAIDTARGAGLRPVGVIAVDLFGQPAMYDEIEPLCRDAGLWLMSDAAQSFGATYRGRSVGTVGEVTATSFFPAKPLGCYGDGGAVFTDDLDLAAHLRSLRVHGQGADKYDNVHVGMNGRLDTIQAAILIVKLSIFADELMARARIAANYTRMLEGVVRVPRLGEGVTSAWAQYTIRVDAGHRDAFRATLADVGVPTAIYYPRPLHRQPAYARQLVVATGLVESERAAAEVVSLPMHPYLSSGDQARVVDAVVAAVKG